MTDYEPHIPEWWREEVWEKRVETEPDVSIWRELLSFAFCRACLVRFADDFRLAVGMVIDGLDNLPSLLFRSRADRMQEQAERFAQRQRETLIQSVEAMRALREGTFDATQATENLSTAFKGTNSTGPK